MFLAPLGAFAQQSFTPSLVPLVDSRYYIGTTTPSLRAFLQVIADSFYDTNASDGCATWASNVLTSTGSACGAGGGGSGGGTWATTTSQVTGQLINYPLNDTDIVTVGSNATTSAEVYFDPNLVRTKIFNQFFDLSSTTLQRFTFTLATGTSATTTNLFSTTASSTNLFTSLFTVAGTGLVVDSARNTALGYAAPANKLDVAGNVSIGSGNFLGFMGNAAVSSANYSLFGNTTLTLLNARSGASIGFRINNVDVANFTTTGGYGFGNTYYNLDPGQNNMNLEGSLGIGVSVPLHKLHVVGNALITGNSTTTSATTTNFHISNNLFMSGTGGLVYNSSGDFRVIGSGQFSIESGNILMNGNDISGAGLGDFSSLSVSGLSDGCLQAATFIITSTGSACGSGGGGSDPFTHPQVGTSATTSGMIFTNASSTFTGNLNIVGNATATNATTTHLNVTNYITAPNIATTTLVSSQYCNVNANSLNGAFAGNSYFQPSVMTNNFISHSFAEFTTGTTSQMTCLFVAPHSTASSTITTYYTSSSTSAVNFAMDLSVIKINPFSGSLDPASGARTWLLNGSTTAAHRMAVAAAAYQSNATTTHTTTVLEKGDLFYVIYDAYLADADDTASSDFLLHLNPTIEIEK